MSAKQPTLLDLPIAVANHVLEKLKLNELWTCRKVCRSLRTAVDNFGAQFTDLSVVLDEDSVRIQLDRIEIIYRNCSLLSGSSVWCNNEWKYLEGENCLKLAFNDLKILLKHASCLYIISYLNDQDREHAVNSLVDVLKKEVDIHMKTISLHRDLSIDDIVLILPLFNSQTLRKLWIRGIFPAHDFERITHLDQWKKAKKFKLWETSWECLPIEYFFHFEKFRIDIVKNHDIPIQSVIKIRDDLLQRSTFRKCVISVINVNFNPELARIFQPDYAGCDEFTMEYSTGKSKFEIYYGIYEFMNMWQLRIKRC
ncbi:F-box domain-containing protein [Caenorhabditis elegans]|uniref:F-box domain-containing protein n=1 Tax=Caenorhabditis elegans TaxID=6239 RepID=Q966E6_CAEEL|nr:F-box domain-containing protein [Caenorhabditis elegans]CCD73912.1 F-box domain-containing protein [Caenorhabditis elegans]|eukprot:NP_497373.2 F-box A protein [Caenorhabditis elegans]